MVTSPLNDRRRWGIIYCPRIGAVNKIKKWREIRAYLIEKGVTYDYIQSEDYGSVERLARMLVDNGYETIVVVGGDGAIQDALNG
ncbi:MAG: acylglycerol kinase family protein, partial [Bacteroidaceae bacterium]|nr:acylglycerol kinase family protein [Bacteroidaceae bacterium]